MISYSVNLLPSCHWAKFSHWESWLGSAYLENSHQFSAWANKLGKTTSRLEVRVAARLQMGLSTLGLSLPSGMHVTPTVLQISQWCSLLWKGNERVKAVWGASEQLVEKLALFQACWRSYWFKIYIYIYQHISSHISIYIFLSRTLYLFFF